MIRCRRIPIKSLDRRIPWLIIRPQLTAPDAVVLVSEFVETLAATAGATGFLSELEAGEAASRQPHGSGRVK